MSKINSPAKGYILVALLSAFGGGFIVAVLTKAIPKMIQQIMSGMMRNMMAEMSRSGCSPGEM